MVVMTLFAAVLGIYRWWGIVSQRRLQAYIRSCTFLPEYERDLLCGWTRDKALMETLGVLGVRDDASAFRAELSRPLIWQCGFVNTEGRERHIFVFGAIWQENDGTVVLCDDHDRLLSWSLSPIGSDFRSAWLTTHEQRIELTTDAFTTGVHPAGESRGIHRFGVGNDEISALPIQWEPIEILRTHDAMNLVKNRVMRHVGRGATLPVCLEQLPSEPGRMDSNVDGWGRKIELCSEGKHITVKSFGRDGLPGGTGDDEDIVGDFDATPREEIDWDRNRSWVHDPTESWVKRFRAR